MPESPAAHLRPCPFCGMPPELFATDGAHWRVICTNPLCGAWGPPQPRRTQAVRAWTIRMVTEEGEPV